MADILIRGIGMPTNMIEQAIQKAIIALEIATELDMEEAQEVNEDEN